MNNLLHDRIRRVSEVVALLKEVEVCDQPAPWVTQDIWILQRRWSKLYRIFKRSGFAYEEYYRTRKVIKRKIADNMKEYFDSRFQNCKSAKSLWNDFRNLGLMKRAEVRVAPNLNLNEMIAYFVTSADSLLQNIDFEHLEVSVVKRSHSFEFNYIRVHITWRLRRTKFCYLTSCRI